MCGVAMKVSVIVPVYNAEKYLRQCLSSLQEQTLKDVEFICVDDGSTDASPLILEEFRGKDGRFRIIHQQNQYAGVARNRGMEKAEGEYLMFLDADDYYAPEACEKAYNKAKEEDADVILYGARTYDERIRALKEVKEYLRRDRLPSGKTVFNSRTEGADPLNMTTAVPWTKAFRRSFIEKEGIRFQPLHNSNDVYFVVMGVLLAERVSYVDEDLAFCRRGHGNNLQSAKAGNPLCFVEAYEAVYREIRRRGLYKDLEKSFLNFLLRRTAYHLNTAGTYGEKIAIMSAMQDFLEDEIRLPEKPEEMIFNKTDYQTVMSLWAAARYAPSRRRLLRESLGRALVQDERTAYIRQNAAVSVILVTSSGCEAEDEDEGKVRRTLDSLLGQTMEKLEVICVDNSQESAVSDCLQEYRQKDPRVLVLRTKACGLSEARTRGLREAIGGGSRFFYFIESGNTLSSEALSSLTERMEAEGADLGCFNGTTACPEASLAKRFENGEYYLERIGDYSGVFSGTELLVRLMAEDEMRFSPSLMLLHRSLFAEGTLMFDRNVLSEDRTFAVCALGAAHKAIFIKDMYFHREVCPWPQDSRVPEFEEAYGFYRAIAFANGVLMDLEARYGEKQKEERAALEEKERGAAVRTAMDMKQASVYGQSQANAKADELLREEALARRAAKEKEEPRPGEGLPAGQTLKAGEAQKPLETPKPDGMASSGGDEAELLYAFIRLKSFYLEKARLAYSRLPARQKGFWQILPAREAADFEDQIVKYEELHAKLNAQSGQAKKKEAELAYLRKRSNKLDKSLVYKVYARFKKLKKAVAGRKK